MKQYLEDKEGGEKWGRSRMNGSMLGIFRPLFYQGDHISIPLGFVRRIEWSHSHEPWPFQRPLKNHSQWRCEIRISSLDPLQKEPLKVRINYISWSAIVNKDIEFEKSLWVCPEVSTLITRDIF